MQTLLDKVMRDKAGKAGRTNVGAAPIVFRASQLEGQIVKRAAGKIGVSLNEFCRRSTFKSAMEELSGGLHVARESAR